MTLWGIGVPKAPAKKGGRCGGGWKFDENNGQNACVLRAAGDMLEMLCSLFGRPFGSLRWFPPSTRRYKPNIALMKKGGIRGPPK